MRTSNEFKHNEVYRLTLRPDGFGRGNSSVVQYFEVIETEGPNAVNLNPEGSMVIPFSAKGTSLLIREFTQNALHIKANGDFIGDFVMKKQGPVSRWEPAL